MSKEMRRYHEVVKVASEILNSCNGNISWLEAIDKATALVNDKNGQAETKEKTHCSN